VFLVNSRLGHFSATSSGSGSKSLHPTEAPLLPKLRGYFAEFLNEGSHLRLWILSSPTCVGLRYGHPVGSLEVFLGSVGSVSWFVRGRTSPQLSVYMRPGFAWASTYDHGRTHPTVRKPTLLRRPIAQMPQRWCRNIDLLSIGYAFRPRLRHRLTLSGLTFLRKP